MKTVLLRPLSTIKLSIAVSEHKAKAACVSINMHVQYIVTIATVFLIRILKRKDSVTNLATTQQVLCVTKSTRPIYY